MVRLGDVLSRTGDSIDADPSREYSEITVRLWGKGVVERGRVSGGLVNGRRFVARTGNFIASRIDARNGAMGLVPESLDGGLVTNDFPLFQANKERLDLGYVGWLSRTAGFVELCLRASEGTTNSVRLKEDRFLALEIPLPPIAEQRRIVTRIERLATQIEEARRLRKEAVEEAGMLLVNHVGRVFSRFEARHRLQEFGSFSPHVTSGPRNWSKHYESSGLRFYRAQDIGAQGHILNEAKVYITPPPGEQGRIALLHHGDLMMVITGATVGRVALYTVGFEPGFVSQHVAICRLPKNEIEPEFALWGLRGPLGQAQLIGQRYGQGKPGLNLSNIRSLRLPFPSLPEQHRIVAELDALQAEVGALKTIQATTAAELDALLPAILDRAFKGEL